MARAPGPALRGCVLGALLCLVLWACGDAFAYLALVRDLRDRDGAARGALAVDPRRDFLVLAGRMRLRERVRGAAPLSPEAPALWRWSYERAGELPPAARIRLEAPLYTLYVYGSFFFHPASLEVRGAGAITDRSSLLRRLRRAGAPPGGDAWSHRIVAVPGGLALQRVAEDR